MSRAVAVVGRHDQAGERVAGRGKFGIHRLKQSFVAVMPPTRLWPITKNTDFPEWSVNRTGSMNYWPYFGKWQLIYKFTF